MRTLRLREIKITSPRLANKCQEQVIVSTAWCRSVSLVRQESTGNLDIGILSPPRTFTSPAL